MKMNEKMWKPDCADEWLELIWGIAADYDGYNTVESLKHLIDEIVNMSQEARKCLRENKLFPNECSKYNKE